VSAFRPYGVVLHCTASRFGDAREIAAWHRARGFDGIGYGRVVRNGVRRARDPYDVATDGLVERGRADTVVGAHCAAGGMNRATIGICCVGTPGFVPDGATRAPASYTVQPYLTAKQAYSLVAELASLCRAHGWDPQGTFRWQRRDVPVITQHSDHDRGKPLCASLHLDPIRRAVAAALR
jgi:hypothetical protein